MSAVPGRPKQAGTAARRAEVFKSAVPGRPKQAGTAARRVGAIQERSAGPPQASGHRSPQGEGNSVSAAEREAVLAYVALGANLGDAADTVRGSIDTIAGLAQVELVGRSSLYRTAPIDSSGPDYVNAVVCVRTTCMAYDLLADLQRIENAAMRERPYRNAPRTLDLDLLLFGDAHIDSATLTLPHPRMGERAFVLVPLAEIAPGLVDASLLRRVSDQGCVRLP